MSTNCIEQTGGEKLDIIRKAIKEQKQISFFVHIKTKDWERVLKPTNILSGQNQSLYVQDHTRNVQYDFDDIYNVELYEPKLIELKFGTYLKNKETKEVYIVTRSATIISIKTGDILYDIMGCMSQTPEKNLIGFILNEKASQRMDYYEILPQQSIEFNIKKNERYWKLKEYTFSNNRYGIMLKDDKYYYIYGHLKDALIHNKTLLQIKKENPSFEFIEVTSREEALT